MDFSFFKHLFKILLTFILALNLSESAQLAKDGGYDLTLAIDELTPVPLNVAAYRANIQTDLTLFSTQLWKTTVGRFYINSVDILIPSSWDTPTEIATSQAYATSDFKISVEFEAPRVENPNPCGAVGRHIELPFNFFNQSRSTSNYGESAKALLNLFARYRFGVWEEHGNFESENYPYFYMKPSLQPVWEATGCSSYIKGSILNVNGEESANCDRYNPTGPTENCRFIPSASNTGNSSLTYLPWANSVHQFCDMKTHNYDAPSRHNHFCGHRSVWEVIRESEDYWTVTTSSPVAIGVPKFNFFKTSTRPLFYLLLDRGRTATTLNVLGDVKESLKGLFDGSFLNPEVIATIGTYPHAPAGRDHQYVREEAAWSSIGSKTNFSSVIDHAIGFIDGPVVRDFGEAIKEVSEKIKARNHLAGAVVLIVKRGATQNNFEQLTYAGDVLTSLKEQGNIRVFAIEFQQNIKTPYINLQPVVQATKGQLYVLNDTNNVKEKLKPILSAIKTVLEDGVGQPEEIAWNVFKGFLSANTSQDHVDIPVLDDNLDTLTLCLTTKRNIKESDIEIRQLSGGAPVSSESSHRFEWNEASDTSSRSVTIVKITKPQKDSIWLVRILNCQSQNSEDCLAFLVASVAYKSTPASSPSAELSLSRNLKIDVLTSAENNYLDFDRQGTKSVPLAIYGIIEVNNQRVLNLENVTATIVLESKETWTIVLEDDGSGLVDVSRGDGIYSGVFTPPKDGIYKIYISATHHHRNLNEIPQVDLNTDEDSTSIVHTLGRLIPIDQLRFGCTGSTNRRCTPADLSGSLSRSADMIGTILVQHSVTFLPKPEKIVDLRVTTLPDFRVRFAFTAPRVLGSDDQVDEYHVYFAPKVDNFIGGTDITRLAMVQIGDPPGTYVEIEYAAMEEVIPFYAVEAVYKDRKGGPSNVVGVVTSASGIPPMPVPTTTTTTTTTETPISSEVTSSRPVSTTTSTTTTTTSKPETNTPTKIPIITTTSRQRSAGNGLFSSSSFVIITLFISLAYKFSC